MAAILLDDSQLTRIGKYPAPNVPGYSSLFFHHLTEGESTQTYKEWGCELTTICEEEGRDYYYFYNDYDTKINVYPNDIIEEWYHNR